MNLPIQSQPVNRMVAGQSALQFTSNTSGVNASGGVYGVEASGIFDDIMRGVQTVGSVAGPILGAFGI